MTISVFRGGVSFINGKAHCGSGSDVVLLLKSTCGRLKQLIPVSLSLRALL